MSATPDAGDPSGGHHASADGRGAIESGRDRRGTGAALRRHRSGARHRRRSGIGAARLAKGLAMNLTVNGKDVFAATGGREFDKSLPSVVLIHGAGHDHSVWALHSRWFAHHGFALLAPDLPGHGRSKGAALKTIAEMADWTAALLDAAGAIKAHLIGHSMGSLIALETAARHPAKVSALGLIGTAAVMTVGPDLLKAAEANDDDAIDMCSIWGLGFDAGIGGSMAPGLWMHGGAQRMLERCAPGVLFADLSACNSYQDAIAA